MPDTKHTKKRVTKKHTRDPYERQKERLAKLQRCVLWPDAKPTCDKSGQTNGKLSIILPVYRQTKGKNGTSWFYLAECSCQGADAEIILNNMSTTSCGCARKEGLKKSWATRRANRAAGIEPTKKRIKPVDTSKIDRFKTCHRHNGQYTCAKYSDYLSAAGGEEGFEMCYKEGGSCFEGGRDYRQYAGMEEVV